LLLAVRGHEQVP